MKIILTLALLFICSVSGFSQESLAINWPDKYGWKVLTNQETEAMHMIELIPGTETGENWTLLGQMLSVKGVTNMSMDKARDLMLEQTKKNSPKAKLTEIERNESDKNPWILFKIECPSFNDDKNPESQLWYVRQGQTSLYLNFIAIKEKKLSPEFVKEWVDIFKKSEFVQQ